MSPQALSTHVRHRIIFECTQTLESALTQGQRVNATDPSNTKGTCKWEAGGSVTPFGKGKLETLPLLDLSQSTLST
eukprot:14100767-Ditylum_brightwellii.AAC.1